MRRDFRHLWTYEPSRHTVLGVVAILAGSLIWILVNREVGAVVVGAGVGMAAMAWTVVQDLVKHIELLRGEVDRLFFVARNAAWKDCPAAFLVGTIFTRIRANRTVTRDEVSDYDEAIRVLGIANLAPVTELQRATVGWDKQLMDIGASIRTHSGPAAEAAFRLGASLIAILQDLTIQGTDRVAFFENLAVASDGDMLSLGIDTVPASYIHSAYRLRIDGATSEPNVRQIVRVAYHWLMQLGRTDYTQDRLFKFMAEAVRQHSFSDPDALASQAQELLRQP
jgi:hypothetical protein